MLAGNWAIRPSSLINTTDLWWAKTIVSSYVGVALNINPFNHSITVEIARILKKLNPKFKVLIYQNSDFGPDTNEASAIIKAHPEWWCRDNGGGVVKINGKFPWVLNHSRSEVRSFYNNWPLKIFGDEAKELVDGIFNDGMGYSPNALGKYTGLDRYDEWFRGLMTLGDEARAIYGGLNGGEVWGNAALGVTARWANITYNGSLVSWRTVMDHIDGGFLEGAGGYWYINQTTGDWIPDYFNLFLEVIINASTAGKTVVLHFNPGPSFPPFVYYPINSTGDNRFIANKWLGPRQFPNTADGVRQAAADSLVQTLAPFLITANEHVFLQYSWFYEMQDGCIPCPEGMECGMPSKWYPEYSKPLGPPKGPAVNKGYIWTREFAHASVYVDSRDRWASKITWHSAQ
jgi:hypothetical protein